MTTCSNNIVCRDKYAYYKRKTVLVVVTICICLIKISFDCFADVDSALMVIELDQNNL